MGGNACATDGGEKTNVQRNGLASAGAAPKNGSMSLCPAIGAPVSPR